MHACTLPRGTRALRRPTGTNKEHSNLTTSMRSKPTGAAKAASESLAQRTSRSIRCNATKYQFVSCSTKNAELKCPMVRPYANRRRLATLSACGDKAMHKPTPARGVANSSIYTDGTHSLPTRIAWLTSSVAAICGQMFPAHGWSIRHAHRWIPDIWVEAVHVLLLALLDQQRGEGRIICILRVTTRTSIVPRRGTGHVALLLVGHRGGHIAIGHLRVHRHVTSRWHRLRGEHGRRALHRHTSIRGRAAQDAVLSLGLPSGRHRRAAIMPMPGGRSPAHGPSAEAVEQSAGRGAVVPAARGGLAHHAFPRKRHSRHAGLCKVARRQRPVATMHHGHLLRGSVVVPAAAAASTHVPSDLALGALAPGWLLQALRALQAVVLIQLRHSIAGSALVAVPLVQTQEDAVRD
mmetsp:Transcript_121215/g.387256  ORF Transcript_121215/g.387256 Transcript_121215/m.387256 type:complete len:407 (-) Transcript_121215:1092-2312(-)